MVGFHGTSILADGDIQTYGFLPKKVFSNDEHQTILEISISLDVYLSGYPQWLAMRSVSFADTPEGAISQMRDFNGGQGLNGMSDVLKEIVLKGSVKQKDLANEYLEKISAIKTTQPVVYAVDLSQFGKRIFREHGCYQYHLNPELDFPLFSDITPSLIIERLDLQF